MTNCYGENKQIKNSFRKFIDAVKTGDLKAVITLCQEKWIEKDINDGWRPIHFACQNGHDDVVQLLLNRKCQIEAETKDGLRPIHLACQNGQAAVVQLLLNRKCQIETESKCGCRPIHVACGNGYAAVVQLLLDKNCHMEAETKDGWRPIHWACAYGHASVAQLLLNRKCQMEPEENVGLRPIHLACQYGRADVAKLLLDRNCQMEPQSKDGCRPIHLACCYGHADVVQLLLDRNCQMEPQTKDGCRPINLAHWKGHAAVVQLLLNRNCKMEPETKSHRENDEFKLFHLKKMTIVCRKYKISDFPAAVQKIKENVLPLKRPIVLCDSVMIESNLPPSLVVVPLVSDRLKFVEYVIIEKENSEELTKYLIKQIRGWDVECTFEKPRTANETNKIRLNIKSKDNAFNWEKERLVKLNLQNEGSKETKETIQLLVWETATVKEIKTTFVECLKFFHSLEIQKEIRKDAKHGSLTDSMQRVTFSETQNSDCVSLKKLMLMRKQLMTFYDKNRRKLLDNILTKDVVDSVVTVEQKCVKTMEFIPLLQDNISLFASEDTLLVISITDDAPAFVLLRKSYKSIKDVRQAIGTQRKNSGRVGLVSMNSIVKDDVDIWKLFEVIHYFIVERYDDSCCNVKKLGPIGRGGFGFVHGCSIDDDKSTFVVKEIVLTENEKSDTFWEIVNEIVVTARIGSHPRIMNWIRFLEADYAFYIVMHRMEMSLSDHIERRYKANQPLTEKEIIHFTKQILEGVDYLHDNKIAHRDIKGTNILLDKSGNVKLTDFGVSKCLNVNTSQAHKAGAETHAGSVNWMAPEVIDSTYGLKCDVWSVGATVVQMITGKPPFHRVAPQMVAVMLYTNKKIDYEYPAAFSKDLQEFVDACLKADPNQRPDCKTLLEYSIFK